MKFYLIGGIDLNAAENSVEIERKALADAKNKNVFVLDLTSNNPEKLAKYRNVLTSYLKKAGAEKIRFISSCDSTNKMEKGIREAGLVYIPGGDTEVLMQNIEERNLKPILRSLKSVLVGNSAGALAMCEEVILTKDEDVAETKVLPGLGLVPFSVEVHYDETHDKELFELSKDREIYAIPEKCVIAYDRKMNFIGDIWKFSRGKREKIN